MAERDRIVGAGGDRHRILAVAAVEGDDVGAVAERERIDPAAADEQVGAIAAAELVVMLTPPSNTLPCSEESLRLSLPPAPCKMS
ncbi:hypothetical protein LP419_11440 [Massilia sp. H-1]|nr:hypothetical protein LP419_11440 [Massilia sp. H-1]